MKLAVVDARFSNWAYEAAKKLLDKQNTQVHESK